MAASLRDRIWALWHLRVEYARNPLLRWVGQRIYTARRYLQGARRVELAGFGETGGVYLDEGVEIHFGGACPVQGEGTVDGRECYYRSRGEGWQFHVAAPGSEDVFGDDAWSHSERCYVWPDGGWVSADVSRACIAQGVAAFRASMAGSVAP